MHVVGCAWAAVSPEPQEYLPREAGEVTVAGFCEFIKQFSCIYISQTSGFEIVTM